MSAKIVWIFILGTCFVLLLIQLSNAKHHHSEHETEDTEEETLDENGNVIDTKKDHNESGSGDGDNGKGDKKKHGSKDGDKDGGGKGGKGKDSGKEKSGQVKRMNEPDDDDKDGKGKGKGKDGKNPSKERIPSQDVDDKYKKDDKKNPHPEKNEGDGNFDATTIRTPDQDEGDDGKNEDDSGKGGAGKDNSDEDDGDDDDDDDDNEPKKDIDGEDIDTRKKLDKIGNSFEEFDLAAAHLYPLGDALRNGLPDTHKRMEKYCQKWRPRVSTFDNYIKSRISKQNPLFNGFFIQALLEVYSLNIKIFLQKYCNDQSKKNEFIKKAKIVNKENLKLYRIRKSFINILIKAMTIENQFETVQLCCTHYKYLDLSANTVDSKVKAFVQEMIVAFQSLEVELWCGFVTIGSVGCQAVNTKYPFKAFRKPYFDAPQYAWVELFIHDLSITRHARTVINLVTQSRGEDSPQEDPDH